MPQKLKKYVSEHKRGVKVAAIVLFSGIVYLIIVRLTSFRIPCLFYKLTGFACPGCGITTLITRLSRLQFKEAIRENYAAAVILPIYGVIYAIRLIKNPKVLQDSGWLFKAVTVTFLFLLVIFGVVRNIPGFEFLLPTHMK